MVRRVMPAIGYLPSSSSKMQKLLAFAEGRVDGCDDFGDVDIVMKHSDDGGLNWSKQKILINNRSSQAGNPAPVVDLS